MVYQTALLLLLIFKVQLLLLKAQKLYQLQLALSMFSLMLHQQIIYGSQFLQQAQTRPSGM
jgi:hypothetical protein